MEKGWLGGAPQKYCFVKEGMMQVVREGNVELIRMFDIEEEEGLRNVQESEKRENDEEILSGERRGKVVESHRRLDEFHLNR